VVIYTAALAWIAFGPVFGIPHAPVVAFVVGLLELIPLIGPAITLVIVGMISAQQGSIAATVGLFAFAIALRLSLDELVAPLILGKMARLHPAVIIFAFLSGGALFGILGLLLAVPVAASIKIVLSIYYAEPIAKQSEAVLTPRRKAG
jgi:predicted PurR-regulated permease PerM